MAYVVEIQLIDLLSRNTLSRNSDVGLNLTWAESGLVLPVVLALWCNAIAHTVLHVSQSFLRCVAELMRACKLFSFGIHIIFAITAKGTGPQGHRARQQRGLDSSYYSRRVVL